MRMVIITIGCFILLFIFTPARAAVVFFDTIDPFVLPGETISISIFSTVETDSIRMDRISDADFGIASNLYLNPDYGTWQFSEGTAVNSGGILIEDVSGGWDLVGRAISGVLYSFDYLVPMAQPGQVITIFADSSGNAVNHVFAWVDDDLVYVMPDSLTLTVVPEPATIYVLLIGGLLAVRKLQQR